MECTSAVARGILLVSIVLSLIFGDDGDDSNEWAALRELKAFFIWLVAGLLKENGDAYCKMVLHNAKRNNVLFDMVVVVDMIGV